MGAKTPTRSLALFLGLWMALVPAVAAAPAAAISVHAEMGGGMGGCDPQSGDEIDREICAFICLSAPFYTVPSQPSSLPGPFGTRHRPVEDSWASGLVLGPEPAPPKSQLSL